MNNTLEGHKLFPYIAWTTVIAFAFFTYTLASNLQKDLDHLNNSVSEVEKSLNELKESPRHTQPQ